MALSVSPVGRTQDRQAAETDSETTGVNDIFGGPCTVYFIEVTNTGGSAATAYTKLYNALSAVNTDVPVRNIYMRAGETRRISIPEGLTFSTGLCVRSAQQADDTSTSSDPADTITFKIVAR